MLIARYVIECSEIEEYLVVTIDDETDIESNIIREDSHLAKSMLGLKVGDGFDYHDKNYIIKELEIGDRISFNKYLKPINLTIDATKPEKPLKIYLYYSSNSCEKNNHDIVIRNAIVVSSLHFQNVRIQVEYCKLCNKYFINVQALNIYEEKNGILLFERNEDTDFKAHNKKSSLNYNEYSRLRQLGYEVSSNRSDFERQNLLLLIIKNGIMKPSQIIEWIEYLLNRPSNAGNNAISKWKKDLLFVLENENKYKGTIKGEIVRSIK